MNTVVPERHSRKRWGPPEGEQEGESPAFRAGKGQAFLACEPREGHRESMGAKGQRCSLETPETPDSNEDYILDNMQGLYLFC